MWSFIIFILHQILIGDQIKENETGGACNTHGRDKKCIQTENLKGRDHLEELGIDGRNM
jgi:hypothetical protein